MGRFAPAHGTAAKGGETLVWESNSRDERTSPPDGAGVSLAEGRDTETGRIAFSELARAMAALRWASVDYLPAGEQKTIKASDDFEPFNRQRQERTRTRMGELLQLTGQVSKTIEGRARGAQWGYAFAEYIAARAAAEPDLAQMVALADRAMAIFAKASVEDEKAWRAACDEARATRRKGTKTRTDKVLGELTEGNDDNGN